MVATLPTEPSPSLLHALYLDVSAGFATHSYFLVVVTKLPKSQVQRERFTRAHSFRGLSPYREGTAEGSVHRAGRVTEASVHADGEGMTD